MKTEDKHNEVEGERVREDESRGDHASHFWLRVITLLAILGSAILLLNKKDTTGTALAYEMFVYAISISALTLTTLQSLSIARQIRMTRRSTGKITEAVNKIEELDHVERRLARIIMHDEAIEKVIIRALHESKVGANDKERAKIARIVREELNKTAA